MDNNNWTPNHPTAPGNYWFYGWSSRHSKDSLKLKPWLMWVRVRWAGNTLLYHTSSQFLYPESEPMVGLWQSLELPEIPEDFNERFTKKL